MTFNTNNGENFDDVVIVHHPSCAPVGKKGARTSHVLQQEEEGVPLGCQLPSGDPGPPRPKRTNYINGDLKMQKQAVNDDDFVALRDELTTTSSR